MSAFKFNCPHCQQRLEPPPELYGQAIECPACHGRIQIPFPAVRAVQPVTAPAVQPRIAAPPPPMPARSARPELRPFKPERAGNWLDGQAVRYSEWMFWVHLIVCQCPGLLVSLIFLAGCSTPEGKAVGRRLLKFSGIGLLIGTALRLISRYLTTQ